MWDPFPAATATKWTGDLSGLTAISSYRIFQIAAISSFHKANEEEVQTFKGPLQCRASWQCLSKHSAAFLLICDFLWRAARFSCWTDTGCRGCSSVLEPGGPAVLPMLLGCRFTAFSSQRNEQYGKLLRYVSFIDRAALLLKIGYQRTTREISHKEELFLNASDMDSGHSFPVLAVVTLIFLICSPTTSLLSCPSLNSCPGTAVICCGFRCRWVCTGRPVCPQQRRGQTRPPSWNRPLWTVTCWVL